jgi:integrase/recombinase XerD
MTGWQTDTRAALRRERLVPVTGTLEADIPRHLDMLKHQPRLAKDRKYQLEAWLERFGARRRHTITRDEVRQQVKAWDRDGVAASSIRHRMTALSKLYEELDGEEASNPVKGVKRPKEPEPQPDGRPIMVIERVLDQLWYRTAMNNRGWKTLARALVLAHTGMRPSQVKRLVPNLDIHPYLDSDEPFVQVSAGKGGKAYEMPLTKDGRAAFLLFLSVDAAGDFSTQAFHKSWMLACDQAHVARFNPYKLRHSFATLLRREGTDLADVQALLGHRSPKTTARYANVSKEKLVKAVHALERGWNEARCGGKSSEVEQPVRGSNGRA